MSRYEGLAIARCSGIATLCSLRKGKAKAKREANVMYLDHCSLDVPRNSITGSNLIRHEISLTCDLRLAGSGGGKLPAARYVDPSAQADAGELVRALARHCSVQELRPSPLPGP
jgi:hypothetical protein